MGTSVGTSVRASVGTSVRWGRPQQRLHFHNPELLQNTALALVLVILWGKDGEEKGWQGEGDLLYARACFLTSHVHLYTSSAHTSRTCVWILCRPSASMLMVSIQ